MQNTNIFKRNELLAKNVINSLIKRNFNAFYCKDKESANKKILELISKEDVISWGGSITLDELGIKKYLDENEYKTIDRDKATSNIEREELTFKSLSSDVFLMSANAISQNGEIVNIDGLGNRVAALCFGPKKVIIVAGVNKITTNLETALDRAKNYAAPINAQRINSLHEIKTPCTISGCCMDCKAQTSICVQTLITRISRPKGRINVILVNEDLGF